jgi:hypothetical protein
MMETAKGMKHSPVRQLPSFSGREIAAKHIPFLTARGEFPARIPY